MNDATKLTLRLPDAIRAWLQAKAEDEGRSLNGLIVQTLKAAMKADPKPGVAE